MPSKIIGICHICRKNGPLSFEHVPPRKAFNNRPVIKVNLEKMIELGPNVYPKGPKDQKGMGSYSLCDKCNNDTGAWYSPFFIDWCYRGMNILKMANWNPNLLYYYDIKPLAVIKQIITMFMAINDTGFGIYHDRLSELLLEKENIGLPSAIRIFTYYNIQGIHRNTGLSYRIQYPSMDLAAMSEISFPPFGYLLTIDTPKPDNRLLEISNFANWKYDDNIRIEMKLPVLPTYLIYPGDYRTLEEINSSRAAQPAAEADH